MLEYFMALPLAYAVLGLLFAQYPDRVKEIGYVKWFMLGIVWPILSIVIVGAAIYVYIQYVSRTGPFEGK